MKQMRDIPVKFHNMVQPKERPELGKPDFDFIIPSGQFWNSLSENERKTLRQLLKDEGQDLEDYLHAMRQMFPFTPAGK